MQIALCLVSSPAQVDSLMRFSACSRQVERLLMIVVRFDISPQGAIAVNQYNSALSELHGKIVIPEAVFARLFRFAQWFNSFDFVLFEKFKSHSFNFLSLQTL